VKAGKEGKEGKVYSLVGGKKFVRRAAPILSTAGRRVAETFPTFPTFPSFPDIASALA
jgi:hypothetical protein